MNRFHRWLLLWLLRDLEDRFVWVSAAVEPFHDQWATELTDGNLVAARRLIAIVEAEGRPDPKYRDTVNESR